MKFKSHISKLATGLICIFLFVLVNSCGVTQQAVPPTPEPTTSKPPPAKPQPSAPEKKETPKPFFEAENIPDTPREMRAVWIASVANIDWPSEPGLPVDQQKEELRALLHRAAELNMNAVFFQVRPAADALYESPYEPWSAYLTGKQGKAPQPFYDPLHFAIAEAHKLGLELHAWFNPFRAHHPTAEKDFAATHVKNINPNWVVSYGPYQWINPGIAEARTYSMNVILDVARRYNIDGVHLDDYFYPYPERTRSGTNKPFPDEKAYQEYVSQNGPIRADEWRRQNINQFVERLHQQLHQVKPNIVFGISPFGIWRPGSPAQIKGLDAFASIYADARKWLNEGWVDYLSPQLYWPINQQAQSFPVLLDWWQQQNIYDRHLWPGLYTSQVGSSWNAHEIAQQIDRTRAQNGATGHVHFSMQALMNNAGNVASHLLTHKYTEPALVPATPWLADGNPPQPRATLERIDNRMIITFPPNELFTPWRVIVKMKYGDSWETQIHPGWKQTIAIPDETEHGDFIAAVLTVVNKQSIESAGQILLPTPSSQTLTE